MFNRIRIYLQEMFPLRVNIPFTLMLFLGIYLLVNIISGINQFFLSGGFFTGLISVFLIMLVMRIADEFKDEETDKLLFPDRPYPRGAVRRKDLLVLAWSSLVVILVLNSTNMWRSLAILVVLLYQYLTYKWFFMEQKMRRSLFLALVSHQPLALLVNAYMVVFSLTLMFDTIPWYQLNLEALFLIALLFWMPVLGWETSRKIKARGTENDYTTYSKLLGPSKACLIPLTFVWLWAGLSIYFHRLLHFQASNLWILALLTAVTTYVYVRFMVRPSEKNNRVKGITQGYFVLCLINLIIQIAFHWNTVW